MKENMKTDLDLEEALRRHLSDHLSCRTCDEIQTCTRQKQANCEKLKECLSVFDDINKDEIEEYRGDEKREIIKVKNKDEDRYRERRFTGSKITEGEDEDKKNLFNAFLEHYLPKEQEGRKIEEDDLLDKIDRKKPHHPFDPTEANLVYEKFGPLSKCDLSIFPNRCRIALFCHLFKFQKKDIARITGVSAQTMTQDFRNINEIISQLLKSREIKKRGRPPKRRTELEHHENNLQALRECRFSKRVIWEPLDEANKTFEQFFRYKSLLQEYEEFVESLKPGWKPPQIPPLDMTTWMEDLMKSLSEMNLSVGESR